nr:uncharacterized protein LOC123284254 isoform X2 [Equus asinus]
MSTLITESGPRMLGPEVPGLRLEVAPVELQPASTHVSSVQKQQSLSASADSLQQRGIPSHAVLGRNLYPLGSREMRPRTVSAVPEKAVAQHIECDLEPRLVATQFLGAFPRSACVNSRLNSAAPGQCLGGVAAPG